MVKFLGAPLEIPNAVSGQQAVRRTYVDAADTALSNRVGVLEASAGGAGASYRIKDVSANYTAAPLDFVLVDATSAPLTITLPANPVLNAIVGVKKVDNGGNTVTVVPQGTATVDGDASAVIEVRQLAATFIFDGTDWNILSTVSFETATTFTYRGLWSNATPYYSDDVVYYLGSSYVALNANTGVAPTDGASNSTWAIMSLRGAAGAAGAAGTNGTNGVTPQVSVGTVSALASGATPTVTNTGVAPNVVLNFGLPAGTSGGGGLTAVTKTGAYTAAASDFVLANASSAAFTVTLPASPAANTRVGVKKTDSTGHPVTVVGSGSTTIDGDANAVISAEDTGAVFLFDGTNWQIQSTIVFDVPQGLVNRGTYSASVQYSPNDVVQYNGSTYIAVAVTTGNLPTNTTYWSLLAAKGDTGAQGTQGTQGTAGTPGAAATITAGTTTTGAAGSNASVTNSGSSSAAVFNFTIPRGNPGTVLNNYAGTYSASTAYTAGQIVTFSGGTYMALVNTTAGTAPSAGTSTATWALIAAKGDTGTNGTAATVSAGTTTTGAAGSNASVTNSGTSSAAVFDFTIPRGATGNTGPAPNLAIGTVSRGTLPSASVTGTNPNYSLNLVLPGVLTGTVTVTTDSNGIATINHSLGITPTTILVSALISTIPLTVNVYGTPTSTQFAIRVYRVDNPQWYAGNVTLHYGLA